jgi:hypothetical protein
VSSPPQLANGKDEKKGPEIVEPCFIDETAQLDPTARIGPNVSIGAGVKVGFGVRIRDAIVLDNTTLEVGVCSSKREPYAEKLADELLRDELYRVGGLSHRSVGASGGSTVGRRRPKFAKAKHHDPRSVPSPAYALSSLR